MTIQRWISKLDYSNSEIDGDIDSMSTFDAR